MSYWKRRQEETYKACEMPVNQYFTQLDKAFNQAKRDLQQSLASFYFIYSTHVVLLTFFQQILSPALQ